MLSAILSPTSSISSSCSRDAVAKALILPSDAAIFFAVVCPTYLMPIANSKRAKGTLLLCSILSITLAAERSPILSSGSSCAAVSVYKSL